MREMTSESLTVVIATRNRGDSILRTLHSVFANTYPNFEILVVDQSLNDDTAKAVQPFLADPRFRYVRSDTKGLGVSHNLALEMVRTELVAITDDDCEVPPNWLSLLVESFARDERIGVIYGNVLPTDYDYTKGYIPLFIGKEEHLLTSFNSDVVKGLGIGANMAIRRSAWQAVHGFDTSFGPGSPLGNMEDRDIAVRILLAGYHVFFNPACSVLHYGFRTNDVLRKQAYMDWRGVGSCYAKFIRLGRWETSSYFLKGMWIDTAITLCLRQSWVERRLRMITPVIAFIIGFFDGLFVKVDRKKGHFQLQAR